MSPLLKGLLVAVSQLLLVGSVGAKFLFDRASYPRVWAETTPIDPDLPIRGRYVSIGVRVDAEREAATLGSREPTMFTAHLAAKGARLVAVEDSDGQHFVSNVACGSEQCWRLSEPLAYFIPEHATDPSRRETGEELWVEVTVPPNGAPRPIQLGVRKDGVLTPLEIR